MKKHSSLWDEDDIDYFEERAAIIEFDGGYDRETAEELATDMTFKRMGSKQESTE